MITLNIPTEEFIIYVLAVISTLLILWIIRLEVKIKNIPSVKNNQNINNQIGDLQKNISHLSEFSVNTNNHLEKINKELENTIQGIETMRFNPFKRDGIGGNQSFASSFIDKKGNGVILSSLYSRDRVSVFAKPIKNWNSEHELSKEEKEILQKTKIDKLNKKNNWA